MLVKDVNIEDDYIVVKASDTISEVAKEIAKSAIPDAVVVDENGNTVGALDDYDIVSKVIAPDKDPKTITAKDIMFAAPPVYLETPLADVNEMMERLEATALPVMDKEKKLLGVITIMDVLEAQAYQNRSFFDKLMGR